MERSRSPRRRVPAAAALLAVLAASAVYGFFLHRNHLFPYHQLRAAYRVLRPMPPTRGHRKRRSLRAPSQSSSTAEVERLANLPYLQGYRPATPGGAVRIHEPALSEGGLNFFTSGHAPVATLMDMEGAVLKTWKATAAETFPGYVLEDRDRGHDRYLRDAELLPDGGIVAMFDGIGLVRLDSASRVVWTWRAPVHHDLFVGERGEIWTLSHRKRLVPEIRGNQPLLEDFIVELSAEGKVVRQISLTDCLRRSSFAPLFFLAPRNLDVYHTNSVTVLDGSLAGQTPAFRRGNLLVSIKNFNTIAVIDPQVGRVVWALTGQWKAQHSAQLLATGRLLLFDNLGTLSAASRILELDPFTQKFLWSYGARPGEDLLSETEGSVERLRGGNTLITETNFGRVLEVTPDNRVVWEFVNPNRVGEKNELVAIVCFMKRVGRDLSFLARQAAGSPSGLPASQPR